MSDIFGMNIAIIVVTISILISGILIGLGKAFSLKRIELFGLEELIQSIINAALIGAAAAIILLAQNISSEVVTPVCSTGPTITELSCTIQSFSTSLFSFSQELVKTSVLVGYYQTLSLDFQAFAIQPFTNLSALSNLFSNHLLLSNLLTILLNFNLQIINFFSENSLFLLFPLGLVFRSFFATRKLGGFLIALAIGTYLFYPAFIMIFPVPTEALSSATANMTLFNSNPEYATVPIIDLNDNYAIAAKLDNLTSKDFVGDLTLITQENSNAISKVSFYSLFSPLFSLLLTIVFIKELGNMLGSEITFSVGVV